MHKVKPGQLIVGAVNQNCKPTIDRLVVSDNACSLWDLPNKHQHTGSSFYSS